MKKTIGIFGGSFNPIHNGHITLARQLRQAAGLDEVWLMVSPQNPLKQGSNDLLDDRLRYAMTRLALHGEEGIVASDYELHLPRPSYTWNTLQHLKEDYLTCNFMLLIGGDNWQRFPQWYRAEDILREYQVMVYPREGEERLIPEEIPTGVTLVEAELLPVSSTEIRQRVKAGKGIDGLVPKIIAPLVRRCYT
jgi:nicotinate-nucleotide adenylyltransferase